MLASKQRKVSLVDRIEKPPAGSLRTWLKALRVHQYVKNVLVFVPLVTAHGPALRGPHRDIVRAQVLARIPFVE